MVFIYATVVRKTVNSLARWLQNAGVSEDQFRFDNEGNITGITSFAKADLEATAEMKVNLRESLKRN